MTSIRTVGDAAGRILLAAVTRPQSPCAVPAVEVLGEIESHRFAPFAFDVLAASGHLRAWPDEVRRALQGAASAQAFLCDIRDGELRAILTAIDEAGIRAAVIKGAALAYSHYPRPYLRTRGDTDLAIRAADRHAVSRVLGSIGYEWTGAIDGALVSQQGQWSKKLSAGVVHIVDVHWRLFNPHVFGGVLPTEELLERAVPLPRLGEHAWSPCVSDALLLACVHRVAHHSGEDDLAWACDIHRLLASLDERDAQTFVDAVTAARVRAVACDGIRSARARFGTMLPAAIEMLLETADDREEPTAAFLEPGRRQVDVLSSDLRTLRSWPARARLLREHLFPPAAYMTAKYGLRTPALLPIAYARRIVGGAPKWFRRNR